jgi:hypothetical protein
VAKCESSDVVYCSDTVAVINVVDVMCPNDYTQVSYDKCCARYYDAESVYANGKQPRSLKSI